MQCKIQGLRTSLGRLSRIAATQVSRRCCSGSRPVLVLVVLERKRAAASQLLARQTQRHHGEPRANRMLIPQSVETDNRVQENFLHDVVDVIPLTQDAVRHGRDVATIKPKRGGRGTRLRWRRAAKLAVIVRAATHPWWCEPVHVEICVGEPTARLNTFDKNDVQKSSNDTK
jgi:hypothetical protein